MDKSEAYQIVCRELEAVRQLGYSAAKALVGECYTTQVRGQDCREYVVEVHVAWARRPDGALQVQAMIDDVTAGRLERLEETITLVPS